MQPVASIVTSVAAPPPSMDIPSAMTARERALRQAVRDAITSRRLAVRAVWGKTPADRESFYKDASRRLDELCTAVFNKVVRPWLREKV